MDDAQKEKQNKLKNKIKQRLINLYKDKKDIEHKISTQGVK